MSPSSTKVLTAHIPRPLANQVDELAAYVEAEDQRDQLTREGLADVDAHRLVDHQTIIAWAQSLPKAPDAPK